MTEAKRFPTLAVAGAYSGYLLEEGGFGSALGKPTNGEWQEYAKRVADLGATLPVLGPLDVSDVDVAAAFDALGRRA